MKEQYNDRGYLCIVLTIKQLTEKAIRNRYRSLLKRQLINSKEYHMIGRFSYEVYKGLRDGDFTTADFYIRALNDIENERPPDYINVSTQLTKGRARKSKNIKERILYMLSISPSVYFVTLTFKSSVLDNTSDLTRRRYVTRALKDNSTYYVANIDFGDKKEREHYHAVTNSPLPKKQWPYGFSDCRKVGSSDSGPAKIAKYVAKISNHALKPSTGGNLRFKPIIYSREKRKGVSL